MIMSDPDGKSRWILNLTIHDLNTQAYHDVPYVIKWARGNHKGATDRIAPDATGIVHFDRTTVIPCTIMRRKGEIVPKEIIFEAKLCDPKKSRVVGEMKMNLAPFVRSAPLISQTFTMKAIGGPAPILRLSIVMSTRKVSNADLIPATDNSDASYRLSKRPRRNSMNIGQLAKILSSVTPQQPNGAKTPNPKEVSAHMRVNLSSIPVPIPSPRMTRGPAPLPPKPKKVTVSDHLKKFCESDWFPTYNMNKGFHGLDSVIFAVLHHYKFFHSEGGPTDSEFDAQLGECIETISRSHILTFLNEDQKLFVMFGLYLLLSNPPEYDIDTRRTTKMMRFISDELMQRLEVYIDQLIVKFSDFLSDVFDKNFDIDGDANRLIGAISNFRDNVEAPPVLIDHLIAALIDRMDIELVNRMIQLNTPFDFMRSLHWNTFCSRMESGSIEIKFARFREAVGTIQMAAVIDESPDLSLTLCPNLPPHVVLSILKLRDVDEAFLKLPDLQKFADHHKLNMYAPYNPLKMNCRKICGAQGLVVNTEMWKEVCICRQLFVDFPFLLDYFDEM